VSPYAAQVDAIQDILGQKYDKHKGFDVKVKTIDGFQGGEQDIIILSTVRSDCCSSPGFIYNNKRTNVALTRAR
jgi:senataxin